MSARTLERAAGEEVDPRIAARRDAVAADRRRRRLRRWAWVLGVVTVAVGAWFLTRTSLLDVETIEVEGVTHTEPNQVRSATGIAVGDPLAWIDAGGAAQGVEALPWVADASVSRSVDGTVRVVVTERLPAATVAAPDGARSLVDTSGRVLEIVGPEDLAAYDPPLPAIEGPTTAEPGAEVGPAVEGALDVVERLTPALRARVTAVVVADGGDLALALTPDIVAQLGSPERLDDKLAKLVTFLSQVDQAGLATIDLRVPDLATATRR